MKKEYYKIGSSIFLNGIEIFEGGTTAQGFVFKDEQRFENEPDKICYIDEYSLCNERNILHEINGKTYYELISNKGYTRNDFENIVKETGKDLDIDFLFELVDWQSVETLADELEENEE